MACIPPEFFFLVNIPARSTVGPVWAGVCPPWTFGSWGLASSSQLRAAKVFLCEDPVMTSPSKSVSLHQHSIISSTRLPPESPFYSQKKSVQGRSGLTNPKSIFTFLVTWEGTANGSQATIVVHENMDFSTKSWGKFDSECLIFNLQLFSTGGQL